MFLIRFDAFPIVFYSFMPSLIYSLDRKVPPESKALRIQEFQTVYKLEVEIKYL